MNLLAVLSIILLMPIFYPLKKLYLKEELCVWDFFILFYSLHFSITPLLHIENFTDISAVLEVSFLYGSFVLMLLIIDIKFTNQRNGKISILNITKYLSTFANFKINKWGKIAIIIGLFYMAVFYLPAMSIAVNFEEGGTEKLAEDYLMHSTALAMRPMVLMMGIVMALAVIVNIKDRKYDLIVLSEATIYLSLMFFMPRRELIFLLL